MVPARSREEELFAPYYAPFVEATWTLLTQTGEEPKYDTLVAIAMKYLAQVAQKKSQSANFASEETLRAICQQVGLVTDPIMNPCLFVSHSLSMSYRLCAWSCCGTVVCTHACIQDTMHTPSLSLRLGHAID